MMPVCGLIIDWLGWPALYYILSAQGVVFSACWFLLVHDSPDKHPRISHFEKRHIELGLVKGPVKVELYLKFHAMTNDKNIRSDTAGALAKGVDLHPTLGAFPHLLRKRLGILHLPHARSKVHGQHSRR